MVWTPCQFSAHGETDQDAEVTREVYNTLLWTAVPHRQFELQMTVLERAVTAK